MYYVTGCNVFNQWLLNVDIINSFIPITFPQKFRLEYIAWSYNILRDFDKFYVAGYFKEDDDSNGVTELILPPEYDYDNTSIVVGNDEYILIYNKKDNKFWKLSLSDTTPWNWKCLPPLAVNMDRSEIKRIKSENYVVKAITKQSICVCLTNYNTLFVIPQRVDTSHCIGNICSFDCGYEHIIALTDKGMVYTWGNGRLSLLLLL